ncbi:unnamed protein product (macronuclear) [Paramecium tetraurelia]|uniref:Guanylyl cyclase n=1 Tax=Paramecium tetraurelia TaxID=5888 RepID=A0EAN1_PARTE|nr:uncharacterized protein GSPATT00025082001 [Paramecium tetraurelia]CAK92348.1 unnamed protein product [Paramecium tetraurelia]|eukprot:XP_001459745.1 hypothetical protein (macronuclear) [Paramecium tetraurelia strain d4-2]
MVIEGKLGRWRRGLQTLFVFMTQYNKIMKLSQIIYEYLHRKYAKTKQKNDDSYSKQIEFENGDTVNLKGFSSSELKNKISTIQSLGSILWRYMKRPFNYIFLLISIICLSITQNNSQVIFGFVIPFLFSTVMYLIKTLYYMILVHDEDNLINQRQVIAFKKLKKMMQNKKISLMEYEQKVNRTQLISTQRADRGMMPSSPQALMELNESAKISIIETIRWEDLEIGDIIILKRNEVCPADCLILESNQERFYTDEGIKGANELTSLPKMHQFKGNGFEYRLLLSGTVTFDKDYKSESFYTGFIRLKNDPQPVDIKKENILYRGQQLQTCDYIYGLVLSCGLNCQYYHLTNFEKSTKSFFDSRVDTFYKFTLILIIVLSFGSWMIKSIRFINDGWQIQCLADYFLLYLNMFPYYLIGVLDVLQIICSSQKMFKFKKQKAGQNNESQEEFNIFQNHKMELNTVYSKLNATPIADLSLVDSVIFDKTCTLTIPQFKIKLILINETFYEIHNKTFKNATQWKKYQKDVLDNQEMLFIQDQSLSPNQISSIKVSPHHRPMSPTKRTSIPAWRLEDNLVNIEPNLEQDIRETSQQDEANFNAEEIADDHSKLKEIHRTKPPKLFQIDSWESGTDLGGMINQLNEQRMIKSQSPIKETARRKFSERRPILEKMEPKKKLSADRFYKTDEFNIQYERQDDFISNEKEIYSKSLTPEYRGVIEEALFILIVCHDTQTKYLQKLDSLQQEFNNQIDELQVSLASNYDYKFIGSTFGKSKYIIEIKENLLEIPVTVTQLDNTKLCVTTQIMDYNKLLAFQFNDKFEYIQYIREDGLELIEGINMDKEDKDVWNGIINKIIQRGCRPVIYYKCNMDQNGYNLFVKNPLEEIKNKNNQLEVILIVGVQEKMKKQLKEIINYYHNADISIWIASGDTKNKVLPVAYKSNILKENIQVLTIESNDMISQQIKQHILWCYNNLIKQLREEQNDKKNNEKLGSPNTSTRGVLIGINNNLSKSKPFCIMIEGKALEIIENDQNLYHHLAFLVSFCTHLIGYSMNKYQKGVLIKILQKKQLQRRRILVVGDEANDSIIMENSDFAIQIQNERINQNSKIEKMEQIERLKKENNTSYSQVTNKLSKYKQINSNYSKKQMEKFIYSKVRYMSTADLIIKDMNNLVTLLFYDSRKHAEFVENIMIYAFYRCYLIMFCLFFQCILEIENEIPPLTYFQSIMFILPSLLLYKQSILNTQNITDFKQQVVYFYNQNWIQFRKHKYGLFIYKVLLFSIFESFIIIFIQKHIDFFTNDGRGFGDDAQSLQLYTIIIFVEQSKWIYDSIVYWWVLFIILYLLTLISYIPIFDETYSQIMEHLISVQSVFYIILIILIVFTLQLLLFQFIPYTVDRLMFSVKDKIEISSLLKPIEIYYSKKKINGSLLLNIQKYALKLFKNEDDMDSSIRSMLSGMALSEKSIKINMFTQQFKNIQLETKYQLNESKSILEYYRFYYPLSWMLVEGAILLQIWFINKDENYTWLLYFSFGYNGTQILMALFIYTSVFKKYHFRLSKILILSRLLYKIVYDIYFFQQNDNSLSDMLIMQLFMLQPLIDDRPLTIIFYCIIVNISFIIRFSANNTSINQNINQYIMLNYYLIAFMQTGLSSGMHLRVQRNLRQEFIENLQLNQKINSISDTLSILMPKFIRNMINQSGEFDIQENQGEVAILFCDICEFDTIIKVQQQNVVHLLDILFRQYDSLCNQYNLQKIETVGKTYMAASGLKNLISQNNINPVFRALQVAFEMQKFASSQSFGQTENIVVKIGVHYGNVIAGVIGYHKPQFSLIGDTVNTTSRVCSTAQDNQIKISEEAYKQVSSCVDFTFTLDIVEAKGKGQLTTYLVQEVIKEKVSRKKLRKFKDDMQIFLNREDYVGRQRKSIFEFKNSRKPTIVQSSIKIVTPQLVFKSSNNLDNQNLALNNSNNNNNVSQQHSRGESDQLQPPIKEQQGQTITGQNLIEALEIKLARENLVFEDALEFPLIEVDKEKLKQIHQSEDEFKEMDVLILDKSRLYLDFHSDVDEDVIQEFYEELRQQNKILVILLELGMSILILIQNTSTILIDNIFREIIVWYINVVQGYLIVFVKLIFICLLFNEQYCNHFFKQKYFIGFYIFILIWWIMHIFSVKEGIIGEVCIAIGIFLSFLTQLNPIIKMKYKVVESVVMICMNIIAAVVNKWDKSLIYYASLLQLIFVTNQIYKFLKNVEAYNQKCKLKYKHEQLDQLVKHQLPTHMLDQFLQLQQSRAVLKDQHEDVTLLFADIAGFTEYSSKVAPEQVVFMLRNLFTEFDKCCQEKNVYKLYTIGDCYVVMGMVDAKDRNPALEAKNTVEMAFEMINIIRKVRDKINNSDLHMRIGIHTGKIIGGVLGTDIVRYDIYGPDVLIANKMESKSERGQVQVSETTKKTLELCYPEEFQYQSHCMVKIPSIDRNTEGHFIQIKTFQEPSMDLQNFN